MKASELAKQLIEEVRLGDQILGHNKSDEFYESLQKIFLQKLKLEYAYRTR